MHACMTECQGFWERTLGVLSSVLPLTSYKLKAGELEDGSNDSAHFWGHVRIK